MVYMQQSFRRSDPPVFCDGLNKGERHGYETYLGRISGRAGLGVSQTEGTDGTDWPGA